MANPSGRKGTYWESRLVAYAQDSFPLAERRARHGNKDRGDLSGIPYCVIEAKNEKRIALPQYLAEAEVERVNDGAKLGIVCIPRRNHSTGDGYFVVTIDTGFRMLRALLLGEAL